MRKSSESIKNVLIKPLEGPQKFIESLPQFQRKPLEGPEKSIESWQKILRKYLKSPQKVLRKSLESPKQAISIISFITGERWDNFSIFKGQSNISVSPALQTTNQLTDQPQTT